MMQLVDQEQINWTKFEQFLRENIENVPPGELQVKKFTEGYSNQTYLTQIGDWEAVMRRPPFGEIPPKAHDMERNITCFKKFIACIH